MKSYEIAINKNIDKDYKPFFKLAKVFLLQNAMKEAIDNFVKALSLAPDNLKILLKLGQIFLEKQEEPSPPPPPPQSTTTPTPRVQPTPVVAVDHTENPLEEALFYLS